MTIVKNDSPIKYIGKWFIPEMKLELPGTLMIDELNNTQSLKLYTAVDFNGIHSSSQNFLVENAKYSTIFGNCESDFKITLNDCIFIGAHPIGDDLYEIVYEPAFLFKGETFIDHGSTKIIQLTCTFPYFSSWFDTNRLFFGSNNLYFDSDRSNDSINEFLGKMYPALKQNELKDEIKINDDFSIIVERIYMRETWAYNKYAKSEIKHFVHFKSKSYKSFEEFKKLAYNFMQLIQLSTGKLMYVNFVSVKIIKDKVNNSTDPLKENIEEASISIHNNNHLYKRKHVKSDYIHQNYMLFYGGPNRADKLKQIIINWYNTIDKYSPVYNIFLDTFEWFQHTDAVLTQIMFNNRFLNLVQALESYHKFSNPDLKDENIININAKAKNILKEITNPENYTWLIERITPLHIELRKRLLDLINNKLDIISSELFQNKKERKGYVEKIMKIRNNLSHGEKVEINVTEISDYYYKTLIIILSCILLNLGLSELEIKKSILSTYNYSDKISFIKSKNKK